MVIVKLKGGRSKETTFIFMTLSDKDTENIASWLRKKTKTVITDHGFFGEKVEVLKDACFEKFGESPHIYNKKEIPEITV